jgi:alpha-glucosidase (family GH31 glycosyl hydrolase)
MLRFLFLLISCTFAFAGFAQPELKSRKGNEFIFTDRSGQLRIDWCTPAMFRVRSAWNAPDENWMVIKYDWASVSVNVSKQKDHLQLQTSSLSVKIYSSPLRIDVVSKDGKVLSSEKIINGGNFTKQDTVGCVKQLFPDEHFFGFGERMDFLDRRQKKLNLDVGRGKGRPHIIGAYNILDANYSPIPFFMSTRGYGIFFHNAFPTEWDMGSSSNQSYSFAAAGGELDYYFIHGPKFQSIIQQYTSVTGKSPMLPLYGYGLHVGTYSGGTWGYEQFTSDRYVIELAKKLRAMGIPVDILWLDSTWRIFGKVGGKGATSFEWRETFKDPKGMFDSLYAMNYKMVGLHLRPRFDNGNSIKLLDTAQRLKHTYPEGSYAGEFVNYFDTASASWWWNHGVMRVASIGAKFLKTDEGSAFGALANESDKKGPQGKDIAKLHNIFPLAYAKAPYEKFQQFNGVRGLNQTREGYAGIQRYPFIFAGDWPGEWQYFEPVIKAGLNIGLSGVGHWTHCMGGFEHVADPELYIRWVQFGMFSPLAMVFGMDHPGYKEPWNYGEDGLRNFKKYDSLRYRLLPYIYSHAYKMYKEGAPLMRALVFDYQDDENVYQTGDQYLFGDNMLVCPVTTKGAQTRTVYLPEGEWFDFWTGKQYSGRKYFNIVCPLDTLPIFVKAGGIIPMQPAMNYTREKKVDTVTVNVYPSGSSTFNLYEDDGLSLKYQQNEFAITTIKTSFSASEGKIDIAKPAGSFKAEKHTYLLQIHAVVKPKKVSENGKVLAKDQWQYDELKRVVTVASTGSNINDVSIALSF